MYEEITNGDSSANLDDGFRLSEDIRSKFQVLRNHLFPDIIYFHLYYFVLPRNGLTELRYQLKIF